MKKNNFKRIEENLSFLFQAINAPIAVKLSLVNHFIDTDDYEIIKTDSELPLYKLRGENKYIEWETIFSLGESGKIYNRFFWLLNFIYFYYKITTLSLLNPYN